MFVSSISSKLFLLGTITMDLTILAGVNIVYSLHYFCFCKRIWASGNRLLIIYFRISFSPPSRVLILGNRCFGVVLRVSVFNTDHMKSSVDNKGAQDTPPTYTHNVVIGQHLERWLRGGNTTWWSTECKPRSTWVLKELLFFLLQLCHGFFLFVSSCWISEKNVIDGDILRQNYIKMWTKWWRNLRIWNPNEVKW